jgi:succinate dehydrogenase/fumarate reductase cytochrome b subunit
MFYFILGGLFTSGHFTENLAVLENLHLSPALLLIVKATIAFPFCYHYTSGIRHLVNIILHDNRYLLVILVTINYLITDFKLYCQTVSQHRFDVWKL